MNRTVPRIGRAETGPDEGHLVWSAIRRLRRQHDAAGALALLDVHRHRFPKGALRIEAEVARAEALVLLGRRTEAGQVLDGLPVATAQFARRRLGLSNNSAR
ncbi:MAG TPA: hypothetical protein VGF45_25030 [Polyangia bacterium]